jgi:hypothetical protein
MQLCFAVKHICTEHLTWHQDRGELNQDGSTSDGTFTADQDCEVVFHHSYGYKDDSLRINLELNLHPKLRGIHTGPPLNEMTDLEKWSFTKQCLARLVGMAYQISGSFLDPLAICFKILFSQCCKLGTDWKEKITDEEFLFELVFFLKLSNTVTHNYYHGPETCYLTVTLPGS